MKPARFFYCEDTRDLLVMISALPDATPIRQGFGDGCKVVVWEDGDDRCISFEQFDFDIEEETKNDSGLVRVKCQHCPRHMKLHPNDFRSDSVLVQCAGCGKCSWIDTPSIPTHHHLRKGDGYRVGDRHEWNASEHDTGD